MASGLNTLRIYNMPQSGASIHVVQSWASGEGPGRIWTICVGIRELILADELSKVSQGVVAEYDLPAATAENFRTVTSVTDLVVEGFLHDVKFGKTCSPEFGRGKETLETIEELKKDPFTKNGRLWMTIRKLNEEGSFTSIETKFLLSNDEFRRRWKEAVKSVSE